jgi:hypothetical protein
MFLVCVQRFCGLGLCLSDPATRGSVRIWCVTESDSVRIFGALRSVAVRGGAWRCFFGNFGCLADEKFSLLIGRRCPAVHTQRQSEQATPLAYISDSSVAVAVMFSAAS